MRSSFRRIFAATLLACLLVSPSLIPRAQDSRQTVTRPRRATSAEWPTPTPDDAPAPEAAEVGTEPARITSEPVVRVGLVVDARSVTVSTTGRLLNATETGTPPAPLEVARVRIEPRTLPPLPLPTPNGHEETNGVETASATINNSSQGDGAARQSRTPSRQLEKASASVNAPAPPLTNAPAPPSTTGRGRDDANVSQPGARGTTAGARGSTAGARPSVQLTSRASAPLRGEAVYVPGTTRLLLDARAPLLFASDDEEQHPVRFNEKPYRGRLEVFANTRGTLTVVNVVSLEDY